MFPSSDKYVGELQNYSQDELQEFVEGMLNRQKSTKEQQPPNPILKAL